MVHKWTRSLNCMAEIEKKQRNRIFTYLVDVIDRFSPSHGKAEKILPVHVVGPLFEQLAR